MDTTEQEKVIEKVIELNTSKIKLLLKKRNSLIWQVVFALSSVVCFVLDISIKTGIDVAIILWIAYAIEEIKQLKIYLEIQQLESKTK